MTATADARQGQPARMATQTGPAAVPAFKRPDRPSPANVPRDRLDRLTPKERACLLLVAKRFSSKEIAAELGIAKTSVDTYCNRARSKLGVGDRYEAARLVANHVSPPTPTAPVVLQAPVPAVPATWRPGVRLLVAAAAALLSVLALGSLVSGLDALQAMEDRGATPTAPLAVSAGPPPWSRAT